MHPNRTLILFKSNVTSAFLNLPAHPIWQLNQVFKVNGSLHIIHHLVFSNHASPHCWCVVSGLICWIGIHKYSIKRLYVYMDDFFGWDFTDNLSLFHEQLCSNWLVQLLRLWKLIACPFNDKKQEHGSILKIIGFYVDINQGSIILTPNLIHDIIEKISTFLDSPQQKAHLWEWQQLGS